MATVGSKIFPPKTFSSPPIFKPYLYFSDVVRRSFQALPKPPPIKNLRTPTLTTNNNRFRTNRSATSRLSPPVGRCFRCAREGHHAKSCRLPAVCHVCGVAGHLKYNCRKARGFPCPDPVRADPWEGIKQKLDDFLKALNSRLPSISDPNQPEKLEAIPQATDKDGDLIDYSLMLLRDSHSPEPSFDVMSIDPDVVGAKICQVEEGSGSEDVIVWDVQQGENNHCEECPAVSMEVERATELTPSIEDAPFCHPDSPANAQAVEAVSLHLSPVCRPSIFNLTIFDAISPSCTQSFNLIKPAPGGSICRAIEGSNGTAKSVKVRRSLRLKRGWL